MNTTWGAPRPRFERQHIIWLVLGGLFLAYGLVVVGWVSLFSTLLALLAAITVHECAHAWAADRMGDPTARLMGRVSLNPIVHLDPMGTAMMLITTVTGMGIGWGKPVPVSPHRLKYGSRLGNGLVALAGPFANLITAATLGLLARAVPLSGLLGVFVSTMIWVQIIIAVFNLLPIPPLDGHSVLLGLLSLSHSRLAWNVSEALASLQRYGAMLLIMVIVVPQFLGINLLGWLLLPPARFFYRAFVGG